MTLPCRGGVERSEMGLNFDEISILLVVATIGRPLIFSSDFGGRAMHAPTKSKLVLLYISL